MKKTFLTIIAAGIVFGMFGIVTIALADGTTNTNTNTNGPTNVTWGQLKCRYLPSCAKRVDDENKNSG